MEKDRNNLTYWFPKISHAGLPVPMTRLIAMPDDVEAEVWRLFDGLTLKPGGPWETFVARATLSGDAVGYPLFLRTGHTSGKHDWDRCCNVRDREKMGEHLLNLAYFSELNGMFGELPWRVFAMREMLPTKPVGVCPRYTNMPICREFRFFVEDGKNICHHPYWPEFSLTQGGATFFAGSTDASPYEELIRLSPDELAMLSDLASRAGIAVGGAWSVDLLDTERGWFVTDMAEAERSWHWEGCPVQLAQELARQE